MSLCYKRECSDNNTGNTHTHFLSVCIWHMAAAPCNASIQREDLVSQTYTQLDWPWTFTLTRHSTWRIFKPSGNFMGFFHTIKRLRVNCLAVCKRSMCANVYLHMWRRSVRRAGTMGSRRRISSASSLHCPNKSQWRETEGNGCGKKEEGEEEEELRMYDCLIYVMGKERAGGRERSERVETEPTEHQTSFHRLVSLCRNSRLRLCSQSNTRKGRAYLDTTTVSENDMLRIHFLKT